LEISEKVLAKLEIYSKRFGIKLNELKKELVSYFKEIQQEYPRKAPKIQLNLALRRLRARLRAEEGGLLSRANTYCGFFIGESGIENTADQMIRKIKRMPKELQAKYHPKPDVWLDYREDKDTYLQPITGVLHRTFYGIASLGRDLDPENTQFMKLELWRNLATKIAPRMNTVYYFRALPREEDKQLGYYHLGGSSTTRLREIAEQPSLIDLEKCIRNCGKTIYTLKDLDMLYEIHFKNVRNAEPVFIEADVFEIEYREDRQNRLGIDDENVPDVTSMVYIPKYLPMNIKDDQRVIFLGRLGEVTSRRGTFKAIYALGYFVIPPESPTVRVLD